MNVQALSCGYYHTYIGVSLVGSDPPAPDARESSGPAGGNGGVVEEGVNALGGRGKMHKGARVKLVGLSSSRDLNGKVW